MARQRHSDRFVTYMSSCKSYFLFRLMHIRRGYHLFSEHFLKYVFGQKASEFMQLFFTCQLLLTAFTQAILSMRNINFGAIILHSMRHNSPPIDFG